MANRKKRKRLKYIYMYITNDKYELPLAVADSATELAEMIGRTRNSVSSGVYNRIWNGKKTSFVRVYVGDEEDE